MKKLFLFVFTICLIISSCGKNEPPPINVYDPKDSSGLSEKKLSPNPLKNCYFGNTHLHSAMSFDAYNIGCRIMPDQTFEYEKGNEIEYMGMKIKRKAPLDFTCLTDHAEYLGINQMFADTSNELSKTRLGKLTQSGNPKDGQKVFMVIGLSLVANKELKDLSKPEDIKSNWKSEVDIANKHYEPGVFTTIHSYEWTSAPKFANLHRNVFFRGNKVPDMPFSSLNSVKPEDLWSWMEDLRKDGMEVFAISHNGNISNGLMYNIKDSYGNPITMQYAERRMLNEPLTEIGQTKGTSETHPTLSTDDEFAGFELYENLLAPFAKKSKIDGGYVRQAYGRGLEFLEKVGANPYKMGVVGGTDDHSGSTQSEEYNYQGGHAGFDDTPEKRFGDDKGAGETPLNFSVQCLSGVWAEENTRESIFDAMKRKEVFATSGTMIKVRFFGGWNFNDKSMQDSVWIKSAYANGVSMGSDLPAVSSIGKAPAFLMQAVKDPNSGNLDRIQVIKVSVKDGKHFEKIYNAVWSGDRKLDDSGNLPPVGNTVNVKEATYANTIGNIELSGYWTDPDFDPEVPSCYYIRVLEIPVPRWSTYDAKVLGVDIPDGTPASIQERAWSSAIWYTPVKK